MPNAPALPTRKLRPPQAAEHLGVSETTLKRLRCADAGPAFIRIGRLVLYDVNDLEAFAAARRHPAPIRPSPAISRHLV